MRPVSIATYAMSLLILIVLFSPARIFAASGSVPLNSEVYRYLDLLSSGGLLRSYLTGTRPITWAEAYRLAEEAKGRIREREGEGASVEPWILKTVNMLENRIYSRLDSSSTSVFSVIKGYELEILYLEGEPSSIPGIKASQNALVYNNGGIDPDEGISANLMAEVSEGAGPFYLQLYPRLTTSEEDREFIFQGSLRVGGLAGMELILGKENLWWGQGAHGGLYLTNNASPLPMIHLSTPHPSILPWLFRYLGPFRFELFLSELEEDRAVPEPYFVGMRTNFRPVYALEIGMSMTVIFGGEGRPDVSFGDLFDILFGENDVNDDRSNKIAGFDFRLNFPGWQLYGEFGGEDEAGSLPSKYAALVGFYYPRFTGAFDLRLEYADLAINEENAKVWYRHGTYTDGYTYDGRILGHHVGGGGRDLFADVTFGMGEKGRGRVGVDFEQRGIYIQPAVEYHAQILAGWKGLFTYDNRDWELDINVSVDQVTNSDYVEGEDNINQYVSLRIKGEL